MTLRNLTIQVNEGALQISQDQRFVEVFGPEHHGKVCGSGTAVTPSKLWGSCSSRMHDLEKRLQEYEPKRLEVDAELKEEVKHLKGMLEQQANPMKDQSRHFVEQQAIQMAEQRKHFEEQVNQMAEQRRHFDNMMMQMLSYITSKSSQSSSDN